LSQPRHETTFRAMQKLSWDKFRALTPQMSRDQRRAASVAGVAHALHDGYTDMITLMLPLWQAEFGLDYAALGLLRSVYVGTMACLQIPAGVMSERIGAGVVLAVGTAVAGIGYCIAGASAGFAMLVVALFVGGTGSSTQHPVASSLVAHAFAGPRSLAALGTYNFAGDLGKMIFPATLSLMLLVMAWRPALAIMGFVGVVLAAVIFVIAPRYGRDGAAEPRLEAKAQTGPATPQPFAFSVLVMIGVIDSATRMGFLLFLPFVLKDKGASVQTVGFALTLIFAGGAAGKLACTFIGARIGAIATVWLTEGLTALGILALVPLSLDFALALLPVIGIALNGTSSVLYGSVPALVTAQSRTRALSIFYTGTIGSGAIAPTLYGLFGDVFGVWKALALVAGMVLLTLPLSALLRSALPRGYGSQVA
jgi:MFS transporter, FSR family, fosmidomycin resistance protein